LERDNIVQINKDTGLLEEKGLGKNIASRPTYVQGSVEGAYIKYNSHTKYYYLFVSYGSLSSDYNVRVGRSKAVTGPYIDYNGNEMTNTSKKANDVGLKITTGYKFENEQGWMALGHNSVLNDNGKWYLICHARPANEVNWPYLQVRTMVWSDDGWPMVSPEMYAGESVQKIDEKRIAGIYDRIKFENSPKDLVIKSTRMYFKSDKSCLVGDKKGKWKMDGDNTLIISIEDMTETYKVIPSWDWGNSKTTLVLTGMDNNGICIWGKKTNK
jgi:arabinan endo-1,5-alpha-L-arabinosidase